MVSCAHFFMITGYYYQDQQKREVRQQLKKVFLPVLEANLSYLVMSPRLQATSGIWGNPIYPVHRLPCRQATPRKMKL